MTRRKLLIALATAATLAAVQPVLAQQPPPTCRITLTGGAVILKQLPECTLKEGVAALGAIVVKVEPAPPGSTAPPATTTPAPTVTQPATTTTTPATPATTTTTPAPKRKPPPAKRKPPPATTTPSDSGGASAGDAKASRPTPKPRPAPKRKTARKPRGAKHRAPAPAHRHHPARKHPARPRATPGPRRAGSGGAAPAPTPGFTQVEPGATPLGVPNLFIDRFRIPPFLLPIYQAAGIEYDVPWQVLAAINEIESDYGRNLSVSTAGAVGWMQFLPSTWRLYGVDANGDGRKDPYNPVDAIFAAARYLRAAGADKNLRTAIFAYNHADWYVASVLLRARLIGGLPADLVGSLTGLTQGHFPVAARARYADQVDTARAGARQPGANPALPVDSSPARRGIDIFARQGAPAIAVQDGEVVALGRSGSLGRYLVLQDVYGNRYTYGHLGSLSRYYAVPKPRKVSAAAVRRELRLPARDPKPRSPASAGTQQARKKRHVTARRSHRAAAPRRRAAPTKERLFANPTRAQAYAHGGRRQIRRTPRLRSFRDYFTQPVRLARDEATLRPLRRGARVIAGTILGRLGRTTRAAPHLYFEVRPAGRGAPRIDPKPILDGWKLLEATKIYRAAGQSPFFGTGAKDPTIGQVLLMSKETLEQRVLADPHVRIYACGRRDIEAGGIDRRVLATLEFLVASGLDPTVSSLHCGHSYLTKSGNVSEHSSGDAVDIAAVNGTPIAGHQGAGSITDTTIRRLLTLQGAMRPHQIISLMTYAGASNTLSLPDHWDHIHVGFRPVGGAGTKLGRQLAAILKPAQWRKLIDRLSAIPNPTVSVKPSKYAIKVGRGDE